MSFLIDGYNLIHAANLVGRGIGPGGLERARQALLDFLIGSLAEVEVRRTTVVFDAANAPPGLPREYTYHGLTVRFAAAYDDADELIEELIRQDSAPRRLVVVSSDHRLHRAARRRRARAVDSDVWYAEIIRRRSTHSHGASPEPGKSAAALAAEEIDAWRMEFDLGRADDIFPPGYGSDINEDNV